MLCYSINLHNTDFNLRDIYHSTIIHMGMACTTNLCSLPELHQIAELGPTAVYHFHMLRLLDHDV